LVAQVAGTDQDLTGRIVSTFNSLARLADFSGQNVAAKPQEEVRELPPQPAPAQPQARGGLKPEFHYNIQVHLPANGTEEVYLNIFNALRKVFQ